MLCQRSITVSSRFLLCSAQSSALLLSCCTSCLFSPHPESHPNLSVLWVPPSLNTSPLWPPCPSLCSRTVTLAYSQVQPGAPKIYIYSQHQSTLGHIFAISSPLWGPRNTVLNFLPAGKWMIQTPNHIKPIWSLNSPWSCSHTINLHVYQCLSVCHMSGSACHSNLTHTPLSKVRVKVHIKRGHLSLNPAVLDGDHWLHQGT